MAHERHIPSPQAGRRGFTLIELLVVVLIIGTLIGLLFVGFGAARSAARGAADRQAAVSLRLGADQFKADHTFLPPLVYDGPPLAGGDGGTVTLVGPTATEEEGGRGPVFDIDLGTRTRYLVSVWDAGRPQDLEVLRQRANTGDLLFGTTGQGIWSDTRYSKYALAIYLAGAMPDIVDGIDGPGMVEPNALGGFTGVGSETAKGRKRFESYIPLDNASVSVANGYIESSELVEHEERDGFVTPDATDDEHPFRTAIVDRNGRAYRYYRWETGNPDNLSMGDPLVKNTADLNIPAALIRPNLWREFVLDPTTTTDLTDGDTKLRSAKGAIVGAGPNGVFGTEDINQIAQALREAVPSTDEGQAELRAKAWEDNVVETVR